MKDTIKLIVTAMLCMCVYNAHAQAHLGASLAEIKALHPDNVFEINTSTNGIPYATTQMPLGLFAYYFDNTTKLSYKCIQLPNNLTALNAQVEIYNGKYVIKSSTHWLAYLEGGGLIDIILKYDEDLKQSIFIYTTPTN